MANKKKKVKASVKKKATTSKKKLAIKKKTAPKKKVASPKKKIVAKKKVVAAKKKPAAKKVATQKISTIKKATATKSIDYTKAITPLADRLVIRIVQAEKVTPGGIIIPDSVSTVAGHLKGEVLAVGSGAKNKKGQIRPLDVKLGDFVLFAEYAGTKVEFNSEELQIVNESDVMGIVQK